MRKLLAVGGACVTLAVGFAAVGPASGSAQGVPDDAVATVEGDPITQAQYDHWFAINARVAAAGGEAVIPDPPSFRRCVATLRRQAGRGRGRTPSGAQLEARCRTLEKQVRKQTMALLIQSVWMEKEAAALGLRVTDAQVRRELRKTVRRSFRSEGGYRRFLRQTGMTEDDVRFRLRVQELSSAITRDVQRGAANKLKRITAFARRFQQRWTEQTECRSGYVVPICRNGGS